MKHIAPNIQYIGVNDDNLLRFEGQFPLTSGISYNSYFIDDDKIAIVDAVDRRRTTQWLDLLEGALGSRQPDYIIVHHVEPDHSGSIKAVLDRYPGLKIVATQKAIDMTKAFFEDLDLTDRAIAVADNDTLSLGKTALRFLTAPMVHWPEVMVTFDETDGILFTADAFGSFAQSGSTEAWPGEARRYYSNIVGKYGPSVQSLLKKIGTKEIRTIAPLHGPVLTDNLDAYLSLYDRWSRYEPEADGVFIAYASIYGATAEAARLLASRLRQRNVETVLCDITRHDVSYALAETFRLSKIALCSVTYDAGLLPAMHAFIHHIAAKGLRNRKVGLIENGSWAPVAGKIMTDMLSQMKDMTIVGPKVTIRSSVHRSDLQSIDALAAALAEA